MGNPNRNHGLPGVPVAGTPIDDESKIAKSSRLRRYKDAASLTLAPEQIGDLGNSFINELADMSNWDFEQRKNNICSICSQNSKYPMVFDVCRECF